MKYSDIPYAIIYQIGIGNIEYQYASSEEEALEIVAKLKKRRCFSFANIYKKM